MKKDKALYLLIFITFLVSGYLFYALTTETNKKRLNVAESYYQKAQNSQDEVEKTIFLVKSESLSPSDAKKIEISSIYLRSGDLGKAEKYLSAIKNEAGYYVYAQELLEKGDFQKADLLISRIKNLSAKEELNNQKIVLSGNFDSFKTIPRSPALYLSDLLNSINTRNYDLLPEKGILGPEGRKLRAIYAGSLQFELNYAQFLANNNQSYLAQYLLERVIKENPNIADAHILLAEVYKEEKQYQKALGAIDLAINIRPESLALYEKASTIAELNGDSSLAGFYLQRQKFLSKINK